MSSIEPNVDLNNLDPNTRYALAAERTETFNAKYGVKGGSEHAIYDHAKIFVNHPLSQDALKQLLGEASRRRGAFYDLPSGNPRVFLYDTPGYSTEQLAANAKRVESLDCSCDDPVEQKTREQEKLVIHAFCQGQLNHKKEYEAVKARILEFLQG